jgi:hypothetical protein
MTDRRERLRALAEDLAERDDVADAYTAKSFTDRLFVVEVPSEGPLPAAVAERLADHDCYPASDVYDDGGPGVPFAGSSDRDQYRFVDVRSRGDLQSYVVD